MATTGGEPQVGRIFEAGTTTGLGSAELLERFTATRDEATFAAIVAHHGPMVLATCRRVLPHPADADDAFQATFLVFARQARAIRTPDRLAPWLHRVAHRVAVRARMLAARRSRIERTGEPLPAALAPPAADSAELRAVLDDELSRLPARFRDPLVLCYLEGLTHDEAASQLACPVGTVRSRLATGRDRLRARLTRRGFAPGALAVLSPASLPVATVSHVLQVATVRVVFATGAPVGVTAAAALLAQGVLTTMFFAQIQTAALALTAILAAGTAGIVIAQQSATPTRPSVASNPIQPPVTPTREVADGSFEVVPEPKPAPPALDMALLRAQLDQLANLKVLDSDQPYGDLLFQVRQAQLKITIDAWKRLLLPDKVAAVEASLPKTGQPANFSQRLAELTTPDPLLAGDKQYAAALQMLQDRFKGAVEPADPPAPGQPSPAPTNSPVEPPRPTQDAQPEQPPTVQTVPGSPTILMVISGAHDRVTMINPATQKRATLRLAHPVETIRAVISHVAGQQNVLEQQQMPLPLQEYIRLCNGLVGLEMTSDRPEAWINKLAVFDRNEMRWFEHDLPQPATRVHPRLVGRSSLVGFGVAYQQPAREVLAFDAKDRSWPTWTLTEPVAGFIPASVSPLRTVACEAGRFVGIYGQDQRQWSVLELKANDPQRDFFAKSIRQISDNLSQWHDGKLVVPEGDLIHLYSAATAEWTHINTRDDN